MADVETVKFFSDISYSNVYHILDRDVCFSAASERYPEVLRQLRKEIEKQRLAFDKWYTNEKNISSVLSNYWQHAHFILSTIATNQLIPLFRACDIYTQNLYSIWENCASMDHVEEALEPFSNTYREIIARREESAEYRAYRKAARTRLAGGGFGLSNAVTAMIEARAVNAITGIGHSIINAVGNLGSDFIASMKAADLYSAYETKESLFEGLAKDISFTYIAVIEIVNKERPGYFDDIFSERRSDDLYSAAMLNPEKADELLAQSFGACPYFRPTLSHIFIYYPNERNNIFKIAKHFGVDLLPYVESILVNEYSKEAQENEAIAEQAHHKILTIMAEYNISESPTLDWLEKDRMTRLLEGYKLDTADEKTCEQMIKIIEDYPAQEKIKEPLLNNIKKRKEAIWSAEDSESFSILLLNTDISNPQKVAEALEYVKRRNRTKETKKYEKAFENCTVKEIKYARQYNTVLFKLLRTISFILVAIIVCLLCFHMIIPGIALSIIAFFTISFCSKRSSAWDTLTIDGTVVNPLIGNKTNPKSRKDSKSICSKCGKEVAVGSNYCKYCGERIKGNYGG